ncbi:hypothetical protein PF005_g2032 [Phytophthora fragariae]|uniref:Uncharacterized protein n=1 Tax=Phytophthora fragariae TaxID=53985 RepID=A0A6A3ZC70_9STRA|nr:hypothetical protein PF003_g2457 [Phytophthora fragariae]KAE8948266.1 hypothetical protein PF009_g2153 [Phytophthora fragariae]KAE9136768.1 hypothetical protein PF007_g2050 [Phytophthora fragariae]KAE9154317.1 hypothetical protein PF006_g1624 [Phytophthora fragariae]KAE9234093.1 hypothetical protein PF005_g2032 [Phytophthora fragariae]
MECDVLDNSEKDLFGRAVDHFPSLFGSADRRVNMNKARDWWKKRSASQLALEGARQHKYTKSAMGGRHQLVLKPSAAVVASLMLTGTVYIPIYSKSSSVFAALA